MLGYSIYRHWHADSEKYAGCDSLLTALRDNWVVYSIASRQYPMRERRTTTVHHFVLKHAGETAQMHIISNPHVDQLVSQFHAFLSIQVIPPVTTNGELKNHAQETISEEQARMQSDVYAS